MKRPVYGPAALRRQPPVKLVDGDAFLSKDLVALDADTPGWDEDLRVEGAMRRLRQAPDTLQEVAHIFGMGIAGKALALLLRDTRGDGDQLPKHTDAAHDSVDPGGIRRPVKPRPSSTYDHLLESGSELAEVEAAQESSLAIRRWVPDFAPGDTVRVTFRVVMSGEVRASDYSGVVIAKRNRGIHSSFVVRRLSGGERVERLDNPLIDSIEIVRRGDVRRAKLYYLRHRSGSIAKKRDKLA